MTRESAMIRYTLQKLYKILFSMVYRPPQPLLEDADVKLALARILFLIFLALPILGWVASRVILTFPTKSTFFI